MSEHSETWVVQGADEIVINAAPVTSGASSETRNCFRSGCLRYSIPMVTMSHLERYEDAT